MNKQAEQEWTLQGIDLAAERRAIRANIEGHQIALKANLSDAMKAHHERMIRNLELKLANLA